jgi:hypothetical protein
MIAAWNEYISIIEYSVHPYGKLIASPFKRVMTPAGNHKAEETPSNFLDECDGIMRN